MFENLINCQFVRRSSVTNFGLRGAAPRAANAFRTPTRKGGLLASYFQLAPNHPLGSFFQTIGTQSLASLRKTAALPPGTQRFRTPTVNGGALASYFQIARTSPWVRFFRPSKPANFGFVAQNRLIASRPPTIQSPDRIGRGLGFVFSNRPEPPLGFVFSSHRNPQTLASLRKPQSLAPLVPQKTPFLRLPVPFPHHAPLLPSSSPRIIRPALR